MKKQPHYEFFPMISIFLFFPGLYTSPENLRTTYLFSNDFILTTGQFFKI